jgi:hypothetical protein
LMEPREGFEVSHEFKIMSQIQTCGSGTYIYALSPRHFLNGELSV